MAVANLGLLGTGTGLTAGTTIAVTNTTGAVIATGTLIHISGCWDNTATTTAPAITCSTVGGGTATANHATALGQGVTTTAGAGIWHQCFRVLTTSTIASGATIATLTSDQSAVKRAAHAQGFTGTTTSLRGTVTTNSTIGPTATVTSTGTALVTGDLVIGSVSNENSAVPTGPDTDTLNGSWSTQVGIATSGGAANTNCSSASQGKIVTATGAQTYNVTGAGADTIVCVYSLVPIPDPAITQAAYRLYADGTETGATALAAQDTSYTADLTSGDVNLQVRVRLQETAGSPSLAATDDWQLQWEKNTSGTWADVASNVVDRYDISNGNSSQAVNSSFPARAQAFTGDGQPLSAVDFYLSKSGTPTGTVSAVLYAHSGTFGTSGLPTGSALATSTNSVTASTLTGLPVATTFTFDGTVTPSAGTPYFIGLPATGPAASGNDVNMRGDITSPTHAGNSASFNGTTWSGPGSADLCFEVRSTFTPTTVAPFGSTNLTDAAATTNRLGAGSGSFVAGEISETGLVTDLGWSASNHTELLYSITLKQADLTNGDTLRLRVLRNAATTGFTYTLYPTINVTVGAAAYVPPHITTSNIAVPTRSYYY